MEAAEEGEESGRCQVCLCGRGVPHPQARLIGEPLPWIGPPVVRACRVPERATGCEADRDLHVRVWSRINSSLPTEAR